MARALSNTQIDLLGDRLRKVVAPEDLTALDSYRRSFGTAYETVIRIIRDDLGLAPTGRPAKSTGAVVAKLHRESIRLTQMQDIAGCRLVVTGIAAQDDVVAKLRSSFPDAIVFDRRSSPSHGYRAVHVVAKVSGLPVEIQARTTS